VSTVTSAPTHALRATLAVLAPSKLRLTVAVASGGAALGSAVALTAVSAWLISRAAQHPSFVALSLAVVAVRALGISRGVFRYLERLASHDVALRGTVRLREQLYTRLAGADRGVVAGLRRGELMARVGADVDLIGDVLVRGLLPFAVAGVVCAAGLTLLTTVLPAAGVVLACCLLLACGLAPWLAGTAASRAHLIVDEAAGEISALAREFLDQASELTVMGKVGQHLANAARVEAVRARALDDAARPGAWAAAMSTAAMGSAVVGCLVVASATVHDNRLAPVMLALVTLTPLAMVEVVASLPAAAAAVVRGGLAAQRLQPLLLAAPESSRSRTSPPASTPSTSPADVGLSARGLTCRWPGCAPAVIGVDLDIVPGEVLAITGPSGSGKSTLLRTLAGLLPPAAGDVWIDGTRLADIEPHVVRRTVTLTAEDSHVFTTTLRENLLVARGDASDETLMAALERVGLGRWLDGLRDGLVTMLEPGAVSGGERRRLLLARALLVGSRVVLLDEPAEHLDVGAAEGLMDELVRLARSEAVAVVVVTHHRDAIVRADRVLPVR
jgi:ATP-binding cassette subfamily C protein CydC